MKHYANEKYDAVNKCWVFDAEKARKQFTEAKIVRGVVRWVTNNAVPFEDMLDDFYELGLITYKQMQASIAARKRDTTKFVAEYRAANANREYSPEELFEMRAAFGEGEEVVNIFTGKVTRL